MADTRSWVDVVCGVKNPKCPPCDAQSTIVSDANPNPEGGTWMCQDCKMSAIDTCPQCDEGFCPACDGSFGVCEWCTFEMDHML